MKETEKDKFDELFRASLYGFEDAPMPDSWDAIEKRLPGGKSVPFRTVWRTVAAAAVVCLLVVTGTLYIYKQERQSDNVVQKVEKEIKRQTEKLIPIPDSEMVAQIPDNESDRLENKVIAKSNVTKAHQPAVVAVILTETIVSDSTIGNTIVEAEPKAEPATEADVKPATVAKTKEEQPVTLRSANNAKQVNTTASDRKKSRKGLKGWNLGMGAGSLGVGTDNTVNTFAMANTPYADNRLMLMNSVAAYKNEPRTNIDHHTPISFGLSVSKQLSSRFAVQSGLSYTYLSSSWKTNGAYPSDTKQKLHFVGIPLSLVYKIGEWNNFLFYASAGGAIEFNVAGRLKNKLYSSNKEIVNTNDAIRMKEPLCSVNTRLGVSYPVIRFVNAFAEAGASYYFKNGSEIETVRSERPFNVSFQFGLRLGF